LPDACAAAPPGCHDEKNQARGVARSSDTPSKSGYTVALMDPFKRLAIRLLSRSSNRHRAATVFQIASRSLGLGGNPTIYESGEVAFLRRYLGSLGPSPLVFDVGANRGEYALAVRDIRPEAHVVAFEPNPELVETLERISGTRLKVVNAACGAAEGESVLYTDADATGSGFATMERETLALRPVSAVAQHKVKTLRLDDFMRDEGIATVDLLKIDAEGHELQILHGARQALDRGAIACVQFEFNAGHALARVFLRDFKQALPGHRFFRLAPGGLVPLGAYRPETWEIYLQQNIVALLPEAEKAIGAG
jgi:FkbM family methyltransferase